MTQHASGTNARPASARAGTAQPPTAPSHQGPSSRRHATNPR
jgi:hypothetical protein